MMKAQRHGRRSFPGTPGSTCRRRRDGDAGETVVLAEQASLARIQRATNYRELRRKLYEEIAKFILRP